MLEVEQGEVTDEIIKCQNSFIILDKNYLQLIVKIV